jgi:hypothetical protein
VRTGQNLGHLTIMMCRKTINIGFRINDIDKSISNAKSFISVTGLLGIQVGGRITTRSVVGWYCEA